VLGVTTTDATLAQLGTVPRLNHAPVDDDGAD
jgi:hypothetical protein